MYNRYIRDDAGAYTRVPQPDAPPPPPRTQERPSYESRQDHIPPPPKPPPPSPPEEEGCQRAPEAKFLDRILAKLHLGDIDSGDMLLLLILFFLFQEEADEELLIALGLLLIL